MFTDRFEDRLCDALIFGVAMWPFNAARGKRWPVKLLAMTLGVIVVWVQLVALAPIVFCVYVPMTIWRGMDK